MISDNAYFGRLPINRYGLPMYDILVDYINHQNNRNFPTTFLAFSEPTPIGEDGLVTVEVSFTSESGWSLADPGTLEYKRQFISDAVPNRLLTIHTTEVNETAVIAALLDQYGLFLDAGTYRLVETDESGEVLVDPLPEFEVNDDRWFSLIMENTHLLLEGSVPIRRVASISLLGTTISRLLDIRQFYTDVSSGRFPTEMYVSNLCMISGSRLGQWLYYVKEDNLMSDHVLETLKELTGDEWVLSEDPHDFNLYGFQVVYNGLSSDEYKTTDPNYPYVLVISLSELCTNLQGVIAIGYRNDRKQHPGYIGGRDIRPVGILKK